MLYIVATPIGNLEDITYRAIRILNEVDLIICEDTRVTSKLLAKYNIKKPLKSFYKDIEKREVENIIELLKNGKNIALVSDAGTPLISDPGFELINRLAEERLPYTSIPGPSSVINALVLSGIKPYPFTFLGFVPSKGKQRKEFFDKLEFFEETTVFFESPHRIKNLLKELKERFFNKKIAILRESTKIYEESTVDYIENIDIDKIKEKGEFTVVLEGEINISKADLTETIEMYGKLFDDDKEFISFLMWKTGYPKRIIYEKVKKFKKV